MTDTMKSPRDLFLHELGDVLYAERTLVKTLPKLQKEASDEELAEGFANHLEETKKHVENVEQAFEVLGEKPNLEQEKKAVGSPRCTKRWRHRRTAARRAVSRGCSSTPSSGISRISLRWIRSSIRLSRPARRL
jgi:hypothetical protein